MNISRHLPTQGAYNIRDLGGYATLSGHTTSWRRFLRSDSLHRLTDYDVTHLHQTGLRSVIDLRTRDELAAAPNPFAVFSGVHFCNLPLFDALSPDALSHADTTDDHPLLAFYITAIETRGGAIRRIMSQIAAVPDGAVLFNCTAGKDRTGIVAALLLGLAGVEHEQIVSDYALTAKFIPDLIDEFLAKSRANGGDTKRYARLLESPAPTMAATLARIETTFGSVPAYLHQIGVPEDDIHTLRDRLVTPRSVLDDA